jgi:hypothetical protein
VSPAVELARQQWADGKRRLDDARTNAPRYRRLHTQVDAIVERLRRRVGGIYTLEELATVYRDADAWLRHELAEAGPGTAAWSPDTAIAADAAFHLYARGARDYEP